MSKKEEIKTILYNCYNALDNDKEEKHTDKIYDDHIDKILSLCNPRKISGEKIIKNFEKLFSGLSFPSNMQQNIKAHANLFNNLAHKDIYEED